jgi:sulfopyruvate decarboxylase subunit alpha
MRKDHKGRSINNQIATSDDFAEKLSEFCDFFTGVPDSVLAKTQSFLSNFVFSARENHAIAMSFGSLLGGKKPCVLIQNTGLGLSIDSILGLYELYQKGLFIIVSNRGELDWEEIQHQEWGNVTIPLIKTLGFNLIEFDKIGLDAVKLAHDSAYVENRITVLLVRRGNLDE